MIRRNLIGKLDPKFNPFDENYLEEILQATALAWARMEQPSSHELEDRITFRLAGRLAHDAHFAELPYDIVPQYWLVGLNGELLGRLDLRFKHRNSQRDYFAFESKRLHVTYPGGGFATEYSSYVGKEGMMAFIDGYYSKRLPACGMIGYVMDGKCDKAWRGVERRIESGRQTLRLKIKSKLEESTLSLWVTRGMKGTQLGETNHRLGTFRLRLFHLFLPISPKSSPAGSNSIKQDAIKVFD
jgi:hypothetical protein